MNTLIVEAMPNQRGALSPAVRAFDFSVADVGYCYLGKQESLHPGNVVINSEKRIKAYTIALLTTMYEVSPGAAAPEATLPVGPGRERS